MPNDIISLITNPPFTGLMLIFKIIFLVLVLAMVGLIFFILSRTNWLKFRLLQDLTEFFTFKPLGVEKITKQWIKIKTRLESGLESEFKLAIIEADAMLDEVLKKMGYSGESLGERLDKVSADILPSLEQARQAHKTRNNIVHDPDYRLNLEEAKRVISFYETALTDLGLI